MIKKKLIINIIIFFKLIFSFDIISKDVDLKDNYYDEQEDIFNNSEDIKEDNNILTLEEFTKKNIEKQYKKDNLFILTPYVEVGIRIPYWAYKGMFNVISPFTDNKCTNLETFDLDEKESLSKALYLRPFKEINTPFAYNYGDILSIGTLDNSEHKELYDNILNLLNGLNFEINNTNFTSKPNANNDILVNYALLVLRSLLKSNEHSNFSIIEYIQDIIFYSKGIIKDINLHKDEGKIIKFVPVVNQVLCPLYVVNISKFLFIKNALDNYILKKTEISLDKFNSIYSEQYTVDTMIDKIGSLSLNYIDKKIKDIYDNKKILEIYDDIKSQTYNIENYAKNKFNEIFGYNFNEGYSLYLILKEYEEECAKDSSFGDKRIIDIINDKIEENIAQKDEGAKLEIFDDKKADEYSSKLSSKQQSLLKYRKFLRAIKRMNVDENTFFDFEKDELGDNFIKKLKESGLIPENTEVNLKGVTDEDNSLIDKCKKYNKKDFQTLLHKMKKIKRVRENKEKIKELKLEDIKWYVPLNYRFGINGTYYFDTRIGINIDLSCSFSILGLSKSLFLPEEFLQNAFFYLTRLHEPIVSGRIMEKDVNINDVLYSNFNLNYVDMLLEEFLGSIKDRKPLVGMSKYKKNDAISNYVSVANSYSEGNECLCDIDVFLKQINLCLKCGVCVNLNKFDKFVINKNYLIQNFINEFSFNIGLYFNWQRIKISVVPNEKYYSTNDLNENITKRCILKDVLQDAAVDALSKLEINDLKKINKGIEKLVYRIIMQSFDSSMFPTNNKIIGFANNIFDNEIPELSAEDIFNSFTLRPLLEVKYRLVLPMGLTFMFGCEFIITSPLKISSHINNFLNNVEDDDVINSLKKFGLSNSFELLPYFSLGFSLGF